jgi:23S rRNA (cytosine1962-C5)-methyltransferase
MPYFLQVRMFLGAARHLIVFDPPNHQKGSSVAGKNYARPIRLMPDLLAPGGHALLCLNAPTGFSRNA